MYFRPTSAPTSSPRFNRTNRVSPLPSHYEDDHSRVSTPLQALETSYSRATPSRLSWDTAYDMARPMEEQGGIEMKTVDRPESREAWAAPENSKVEDVSDNKNDSQPSLLKEGFGEVDMLGKDFNQQPKVSLGMSPGQADTESVSFYISISRLRLLATSIVLKNLICATKEKY